MKDPNLAVIQQKWHGTLLSYVIGLLLSIFLTLLAYFFVVKHVFENDLLSAVIIGLAILQAAAQLLFFLHIGKESRPQWNLLVFYLMLTVLAVIVIGSLWIMFDLNGRMMMDM